METQRIQNSQSNLKEEQIKGSHFSVQYLLQSYSSEDSMVLTQRLSEGQWNKMQSRNKPSVYGQFLTSVPGSFNGGKNSLSTNGARTTGHPHAEE